MQIIIQLRSTSPEYQRIKIFDALCHQDEKSLLKDIEANIHITVTGTQHSPYKRSYWDLVRYFIHMNQNVRVVTTTDNRKISFFVRDPFFGHLSALVPQYNKDRTFRRSKDVWDSKKWNIADTNEAFILDGTFVAEIGLEPFSEFELTLELISMVPISTILKRPALPATLSPSENLKQYMDFKRAVSVIERQVRNAKSRAIKSKNEPSKAFFKAQEECYNKALTELLKTKT